MSYVELVVKISEKLYNRMKSYQGLDDTYVAVKHGTPIPKEHGRLIDADKLWDSYHNLDYDFYEALDLADAIIEADKESEDKG